METAKLFMSGCSQAVRLPKAYRLSGTEVFIKNVGNALVLIPQEDPWETLFDSLEQFELDLKGDPESLSRLETILASAPHR